MPEKYVQEEEREKAANRIMATFSSREERGWQVNGIEEMKECGGMLQGRRS